MQQKKGRVSSSVPHVVDDHNSSMKVTNDNHLVETRPATSGTLGHMNQHNEPPAMTVMYILTIS